MYRFVMKCEALEVLGGRDLYILDYDGKEVVMRVYDNNDVVEEVVFPIWDIRYRMDRMESKGFPADVLNEMRERLGESDGEPDACSLYAFV